MLQVSKWLTNPSCNFTCTWELLGCWMLCCLHVARPPQRWGSWPMDPRLGTRGSNDLGGAMFKGEHARVLWNKLLYPFIWKSRLFDSTKGGERKQEWRSSSRASKGLHQIYKARSRRKLHQRRACLGYVCKFICFRILFVIIKKGEIVEATWSRSPNVLIMTNKHSKHLKRQTVA